MSIRGKIQYTFIGMTLGLVLVVSIFSIWMVRVRLVESLGRNLMITARTVAPFLDGDLHEQILSDEDGTGAAFQNLRQTLKSSQSSLGLPVEQMYTIRPRPGKADEMEFVVMAHPRPFVGDSLARNAVMDRALKKGEPAYTGIYSTKTGQWISSFAPIKNSQGRIVGLLEVDASYSEFQQQFLLNAAPIFIGILALPVVLVIVAIILAGRISAPLRIIRDRMNELHAGKGDLTRRISMEGADEIAETAGYIDRFNEAIADVIRGTKSFTAEVDRDASMLRKIADSLQETGRQETALIETTTAANEQLAVSFDEIDEVSRNQKLLVAEVVPRIDHLLQFIIQVRDNASSVNGTLQNASEKIQQGRSEISSMSGAIQEISKSSEQIESLVAIIVDISDRIALLSLNASIEAARAGEYGRGFAVVAEEVARLSDSTARQIKDITDIIHRNRQETRTVVERTGRTEVLYEELVGIVQESVTFSGRNIQAADEQRAPAEQGRARLEEMTHLADEIHKQVSEQSRASGEVAKSMTSLSDLSEAVGFFTEKVYQRVLALEKKVTELDQTLDQLKV